MRKTIRKILLENRSKLSPEFIHQASLIISSKAISLPEFQMGKRIACYLPIRGEVDATPIINAIWQTNKSCYLPIINPQNNVNSLCFIKYAFGDILKKNKFNIYEPLYDENKIIPADQLDLVIMPLVGFDQNCNRIGYGGGFYDRTFAFKPTQKITISAKPIMIGIAYEIQKTTSFVPEKWDIPLYKIITEENIYRR
jgi:5-formyltetrahydrofolate cyclo-ligase